MGISNLAGRNLLKLAVSYEWINGTNWFFLCWYKFEKAESYFNNFCMGVVKSGPDSWARGTLKYAASQWILNWAEFLIIVIIALQYFLFWWLILSYSFIF